MTEPTPAIDVLGGLMALGAPPSVLDLSRKIAGNAFNPEHETILKAILKLATAGTPPRPAVVAKAVTDDDPSIDYATLFPELNSWAQRQGFPVPDRVASDIAILNAEAFRLSTLVRLGEVAAQLREGRYTEPQVQALTQAVLTGVLEHQGQEESANITATAISEVFERFAYRKSNPGVQLSIGYTQIDAAIDGAVPGRTTVYGAQPGVGKTAAACDAIRAWVATGRGAIFVTYEMSAADLMGRMMCAHAGVDSKQWSLGKSSEADQDRMAQAAAWFMERIDLLFFIEGAKRGMGIDSVQAEVRAQATLWERTGIKPGGFVVDYLQKMPYPRGVPDTRIAVSQNMSALVNLAIRTNMHGLVLSQLARGNDDKYTMRSLKESSQIEQDADTIFLLSRPELSEDGETKAGLVEFHCVKDRHSGNAGRVFTLQHNLACATFRTGVDAHDIPTDTNSGETPWGGGNT